MQYNNILVITLSSIGDCILTLPAVDILRHLFPGAKITVMSGPRVTDIFQDNPAVNELIVYDKYSNISKKIELAMKLRSDNYDFVIDFRNTAFPLFINAKVKSTPFLVAPKDILHMKEKNLWKLKRLLKIELPKEYNKSLFPQDKDIMYVDRLLNENRITKTDKLIAMNPGAMSYLKRWTANGYAGLSNLILENYKTKIVLVGTGNDKGIIEEIYRDIIDKDRIINLYGQTKLRQLCALFKRCDLIIVNDTGTGHLASYLDTPVLVIFGPGDDKGYGPWGENGYVARKNLKCAPCKSAHCQFNSAECMNSLSSEEVFSKVKEIFNC